MAIARETTTRPADREYGYPFGVDGLLTVPQTCDYLACTTSTVYRLIKAGKLRRGKIGPAARICRRSLTEYANGIET